MTVDPLECFVPAGFVVPEMMLKNGGKWCDTP